MSADAWVMAAFAIMALAVVAGAVTVGRGRYDVGLEPPPRPTKEPASAETCDLDGVTRSQPEP